MRLIGLGLTLAVALGITAVKCAGDEYQYEPLLPQIAASPNLEYWAPTTSHWFVVNAVIVTALLWIVLAHRPIVRALGRAETHANLTLWLGLAANTADAVATSLGLQHGTVDERNPIVRQAGLGLKWVVVTLLLLALWRLRPRLLWIVTTCYLLVVAYHLIGATLLA